MKTATVAVLAISLALGCVRARTPDGKQYTCVGPHNPPVADHRGPTLTLWAADGQYSCVGPHTDAVPERINGQKDAIAIVGQPAEKMAASR
jgi:hypothetical protein